MRFLLLNQTFYPDVMATGQYLTELAVHLVENGHEVTVITSGRAYDDPQRRFPSTELHRGIRIIRVGASGCGKTTKLRRGVDFATFMCTCALRLATQPRCDAIIALTSPPLIAFLGALAASFRRCGFYYWVMDLNPDEAVAAGWLGEGSRIAKLLEFMSRFSLRRATGIIVLDHFMRDRISEKGIDRCKIAIVPPWSQDDTVRFEPAARDQFRKTHGLTGKFVVMYSGNHSPVHPLDTLLAAAERLGRIPEIAFCFIGGGSEWRKLKDRISMAGKTRPQSVANMVCLPYQPWEQLSASLSAADLQVIIMGDAMRGLVHPCKTYNVLAVGAPVLYIGPQPSHVTEALKACGPGYPCKCAAHGEVDRVVQGILSMRERSLLQPRYVPPAFTEEFGKRALLPKLAAVLNANRTVANLIDASPGIAQP